MTEPTETAAPDTSTNVLGQILEWSAGRPAWQRDALRRLVTAGSLTDSDIQDLATLCKSAHGLADQLAAEPLEARHLPTRDSALRAVTLTEIVHQVGVNALAPDQRLEFGPGLTIAYGDNAAGKSGYTRVLKRACRARGAEDILGNVLAGAPPGEPSATIKFRVGDKEDSLAWNDQDMPQHPLANVSVFDGHCAAVYLSEKTDVAFRPFGLDLFDKLSNACEAIRATLDKDRVALEVPTELPKLPDRTAGHKFLSHITSLTNPEDATRLGNLSDQERERLGSIRDKLKDLASDDPHKMATTLNLHAGRLEALVSHLLRLSDALSDDRVASLFELLETVTAARRAAEVLRSTAFPSDLLPGGGSEAWHALWEAARRFSTQDAYRGAPFPQTEKARCPLCQQGLEPDAAERLRRFQQFTQSKVQQDLDRAIRAYSASRRTLETMNITDDATGSALEEVRVNAPELAVRLEEGLRLAEARRTRVLETLKAGLPVPADLEPLTLDPAPVAATAQALRDRAIQLLHGANPEVKRQLTNEFQELQAREVLGENIAAVLSEIERKRRLAAFQLCLQDTSTRGITQKSSEVTRIAVTARLANSFQDELWKLRFSHLEVELREAGGERGSLYHKLVLKRAPGVEVPRVVSEGEARALSIASFFAELSTSSDRSAILFDDPVSSLDHNWRENVARRLAEEASTRQVVVFTHDVAFLVALVTCADTSGAPLSHQYLRRENAGAGVSSPELPWIAMKVRGRIGVLKSKWQEAEKRHRTASREAYEREAVLIYGLLRETWERAVEEVLLGGIVERYRRNIQTQQVGILSGIEASDCAAVEAGMSKCSRWLTGHDQAGAENAPVPRPDELQGDIAAVESFVQTIRSRRS